MISDYDKRIYLHILKKLNEKHAKIFTLKELSEHLNVSVRKLIDFKSGKVIDFWLLSQYASIIGFRIEFTLHG
jgi:hypothetical protein